MSYDKTKRRQSTDFKEVWNIQTDMDVSQETWDQIFHNWEDPKNCPGYKRRIQRCSICEQLRMYGYTTGPGGAIYSADIAIVGDIHSNYIGLQNLIDSNPSLHAIVSVGDLALWAEEDEAKLDIKAYKHTASGIQDFILNKKPFNIPVYLAKGNHDDYANMYSNWFTDLNIHFMQQGEIKEINNLRIGFLGGVYSSVRSKRDPKTFVGREHRFYTESEIALLMNETVDLLVTHQAASDVLPSEFFNKNEGSKDIQELLDKIKPRYYAHGHHHKNYTIQYNGTTVLGLGNFSKNTASFVIMNTLTKEVKT